jgi:hypothetical protein
MSETKVPGRLAGIDRRAANRDPNQPVNWMARGQKGNVRHSAITMNLYSWHSYKNWAEKARGEWDDKERKR